MYIIMYNISIKNQYRRGGRSLGKSRKRQNKKQGDDTMFTQEEKVRVLQNSVMREATTNNRLMVENENLKRRLAELEDRFMVEHDALLKEKLKALKKQLYDISNEI